MKEGNCAFDMIKQKKPPEGGKQSNRVDLRRLDALKACI